MKIGIFITLAAALVTAIIVLTNFTGDFQALYWVGGFVMLAIIFNKLMHWGDGDMYVREEFHTETTHDIIYVPDTSKERELYERLIASEVARRKEAERKSDEDSVFIRDIFYKTISALTSTRKAELDELIKINARLITLNNEFFVTTDGKQIAPLEAEEANYIYMSEEMGLLAAG